MFVVALAGTGLLSTGASAFPAIGDGQGLARHPLEQIRIVCGPLGRCFRIDPYGRRILVPRPVLRPRLDLPRPGVGSPEIGRPGLPGRGPDGGDRARPAGRPGPQGGDQMQHRPQGGGEQGGDQMQHRPQGGGEQGDGQMQHRPQGGGEQGGDQMQHRPQGGGEQGDGQMQHRPQGGSGPQGGGQMQHQPQGAPNGGQRQPQGGGDGQMRRQPQGGDAGQGGAQ